MAKKPRKQAGPKSKTTTPEAPYQTILEQKPDYLQAIGTVSVEMTNLELMLADLLGAMLKIPERTAHAILFAPQATGPRLAIVKSVAAEALADWPKYQAMVEDCLKRARKYQNIRNDSVHHVWGLNEAMKRVSRRSTPMHDRPEAQVVPLKEVQRFIHDLRVLISNVIHVKTIISADAAYEPSPGRSEN